MTDTQSPWAAILRLDQIEAQFALAETLDGARARRNREWWLARTPEQLTSEMHAAWNCCEPGRYQLARSLRCLRPADRARLAGLKSVA